jgi:hypothetical protein
VTARFAPVEGLVAAFKSSLPRFPSDCPALEAQMVGLAMRGILFTLHTSLYDLQLYLLFYTKI